MPTKVQLIENDNSLPDFHRRVEQFYCKTQVQSNQPEQASAKSASVNGTRRTVRPLAAERHAEPAPTFCINTESAPKIFFTGKRLRKFDVIQKSDDPLFAGGHDPPPPNFQSSFAYATSADIIALKIGKNTFFTTTYYVVDISRKAKICVLVSNRFFTTAP